MLLNVNERTHGITHKKSLYCVVAVVAHGIEIQNALPAFSDGVLVGGADLEFIIPFASMRVCGKWKWAIIVMWAVTRKYMKRA
jgi:hypothetical protein